MTGNLRNKSCLPRSVLCSITGVVEKKAIGIFTFGVFLSAAFFVLPAYAQYGISNGTNDGGGSSAGFNLSTTTSTDDNATTGIEHEDIGITGDDDSSTGAEYDDAGRIISDTAPPSEDKDHKGQIDIESFGATEDEDEESAVQHKQTDFDFVNRLIELEAVFVKISDIKGESSDSTSTDGDPDRPFITGQVPNAESTSTKSTSEVVIKGSKIKENSEVGEVLSAGEGIPDAGEVETVEELALFAAKVAYDNSGFNEIHMDDTMIMLDYQHGLKLFGFIPMQMRSEATIRFGDGEHGRVGRVKVKFPWLHVFGRKTVSPTDITSAYDNATGDNTELANVDLQNALQANQNTRNAQALRILSDVLKNVHDPGVTILE